MKLHRQAGDNPMKGPLRTNQELLEEISLLKQKIKELEFPETKGTRSKNGFGETGSRADAMLQVIPDLVFVMDGRGVFLDYKADIGDLYTQSGPTIIGRRIRDITPPAFAELVERHIGAALDTGQMQSFEYQLPMPDRGVRDYEARMVASGAGEVMAIVRDATDRKRFEEALRESEEKYRNIINASPVPLALNDEEGNIVYLNQAFTRTFGYDLHDIPTLSEWWPKAYPDPAYRNEIAVKWQLSLDKAKNDGTPFESTEMDIQCIDGTRRIVLAQAASLTGVFSGTHLVILYDITDRKKTEELINEKEQRYRAIFNSTFQFTGLMTPDGRLIEANQAALDFAGIKSQDVARQYFWESHWWRGNETRVNQLKEAISRAAGGEFVRYEVELRGSSDTLLIIDFSLKPVFAQNGEVIFLISEGRDVTSRKLAEDKIKSLLSEKELLLKEVHHRIKNNMVTVMALLSLQSDTMKDPSAIAALQDTRGRVGSMAVLYEKLYRSPDFRAISAKEYLTALIAEIMGNFPQRGQVTVETRITNAVLDVNILSPLGIIINELLTNAMKYAFNGRDSGKVLVSFSTEKGHAMLVIKDNGVGIPDSVDLENSAGFGLQLVGMLTDQLGGTVWIERRKGAKFIVKFEV